jgi:hypothetical protein
MAARKWHGWVVRWVRNAGNARRVRTPVRTLIAAEGIGRLRAESTLAEASRREPGVVPACPEIGIDQKLARDLTDDEVRTIAAYQGRRSMLKQFDEAWFLRTLFEERERARNPLQGEASSRWLASPGLVSG